MNQVFSVMIWLRSGSASSPEAEEDTPTLPPGHRSFVFNAPALPRVHYAHFEDQQQAETTLRELGQRIEEGKTTYVTCAHSSFAIPAHSVHYVALGAALAQRVNPDEGTPFAQAEHEARAFQQGRPTT